MRAVIDANVFASALVRPEGPLGLIVRALLEKRAFELVLTKEILGEIRRCLMYPRL